MFKYTLDEARKIVMNCAKIYNKKLLNKKFEIIYRDRYDNEIKDIEICFCKENYQHLTGIELIDKEGNIRKYVAALPIMMDIHKVTKITGDYNGVRPYLIVDKIVGNVNFCLGLKFDKIMGYFVPASSLLHNIKEIIINPSQVLAIFSKNKNEMQYKNVRHVAKGVNLLNIKLPQEIQEKLSLEQYIPKS